jgi:DNA-binding Lrp family transcriptional regulator
MVTRAYILIETSVGKSQDVVDTLEGIDEVNMLDVVTGPYDIIAVLEASDLPSIGKILSNQMHRMTGIVKTVTCLSVKSTN